MIHTGSVMIGHHAGMFIKEIVKSIYPKNIKFPENDIFILPQSSKYNEQWKDYWSLLHNAGNFAFANRMFLGLMIYKALSDQLGDFKYDLLYDAPHNFIWKEELQNSHHASGFIHRKGACTAKSMEQMSGTPFEYYGEPVFIPGSMGASSYILAGLGNRKSLFSASHGAGRNLSRGQAKGEDEAKFQEFINKFKIITPIDPTKPEIKNRPDILKKWEDEIKAEAPYAYKDISSIIETQLDNDIVKAVARVEPVFTIKG